MHRQLLALLGANKGRGMGLRADAAAGSTTIYLYDFIAGSEEEAFWFGGVAPKQLADQFIAARGQPVTLRVNSPGGDVFGGRAMQQIIAGHDSPVMVIVDGVAASAASYLIQAASRIEMADGAMIMIHKAWGLAIGNSDEMMSTAAVLEKIDQTLVETYAAAAARRGVDASDFAAMMQAETWFTGSEAIAAGLADGPVAGKAQAFMWDLSAYERAPAIANEDADFIKNDIEHERRRLRARLLELTA